MGNLSIHQLLDSLLTAIKGDDKFLSKHRVSIAEVMNNNGVSVTYELLTEMLLKVEKDGYVRTFISGDTSGARLKEVTYYTLTVEGAFFEGYEKKKFNEIAENNRVETLEHFQKATSNRMTCLTIVIAVGTAVAAVYYGIEIWKFFHSCVFK